MKKITISNPEFDVNHDSCFNKQAG